MGEMRPTADGGQRRVATTNIKYERWNERRSAKCGGIKGFSVADLVSVFIDLQIGENQDE